MSMCHSAFSPLQSGDGVLGKCFTGEFHTPVLSWIILYHEKKNNLAGESWKEA